MQLKLIAAALAAGLVFGMSTAAQAQGGRYKFSVRNDSSETLTCRIQRHGQARHQTVVLRAGQEWSLQAESPAPRTIFCDPPAAPIRYQLRSGISYRMVPESNSVRVVLQGS